MMHLFTRTVPFACLVVLQTTNLCPAQDEPAPPAGLPTDYAKNDKLQQTTGKEHEEMAQRAGKWKVITKFAEMFGGATEEGESTMKLVLDGKFLMAEGSTAMMGTKYNTLLLSGYDTLSKEYIVINLNSMYTAAYEMRGKLRDDGVIEYKGIMKDAMTPQGREYRAEEKTISDDKFEIVVYDQGDGKEFHVLTLTYERIK